MYIPDVCRGCGEFIYEKYKMQVNDEFWHGNCLKCMACSCPLESAGKCYVINQMIYCWEDYYSKFETQQCLKCHRNLQAGDWVRRAEDNLYHLACFSCDMCQRQLSTGEEYFLLHNKVLCKSDYIDEQDSHHCVAKNRHKRIRTTFSDQQIQMLQQYFEIDQNPDSQELERISQEVKLSKRVSQVWFQNSRARHKKTKLSDQRGIKKSSVFGDCSFSSSESVGCRKDIFYSDLCSPPFVGFSSDDNQF